MRQMDKRRTTEGKEKKKIVRTQGNGSRQAAQLKGQKTQGKEKRQGEKRAQCKG